MANPATPAQLIKTLVARGLSQPAIASGACTSQATISRILSGEIKNPSFKIVDGLRSLVNKPAKKSKAA